MVQNIALHPDDIQIEEEEVAENEITFHVSCNEEDMGRIIGKGGKVIKALRRILTIVALKEGKRVSIAMVDANQESSDTSTEAKSEE
jgi:predicted RNA-binding protein YlqC (UPF0109 family)